MCGFGRNTFLYSSTVPHPVFSVWPSQQVPQFVALWHQLSWQVHLFHFYIQTWCTTWHAPHSIWQQEVYSPPTKPGTILWLSISVVEVAWVVQDLHNRLKPVVLSIAIQVWWLITIISPLFIRESLFVPCPTITSHVFKLWDSCFSYCET